MSEIESITDIMDSAGHGFERFIARGAREGLRREAALQDVAGDEESLAFDEAAPDRRRPPGRDTKYHGPSRTTDHEIESAKRVKDGEKADDETYNGI